MSEAPKLRSIVPNPSGLLAEKKGTHHHPTMAGPIPDIATLRTICHSGKLSRDKRPWYVLQRRATIYLTWLVLHTGLEANHVTAFTVFLALAGSILLAMSSPLLAFLGAVAMVAHHVFDKVDGDVARFRGRHSIVGVYLDDLGHSIAFGGIFLGLGVHLAQAGTTPLGILGPMLAGALGSLAMVLGRSQKSVGFQMYAQHVIGRPELKPDPVASRWNVLSRGAAHRDRGEENGDSAPPPSLAARVRDVVLQLSDFSLMLLLVLAGTVVELANGSLAPLRAILYGAAVFHLVILIAVVSINVTVNVEAEIQRLDALREQENDDPDVE